MSGENITHHIYRLKESFLFAAAQGGRIEEVQSLLELGAETDPTSIVNNNDRDETPLLAAVRNGHSDVAALLLAHGADAFRRDNNNDNVLHLAASSGDETFISLLTPICGELVCQTNKDGFTPIDIAVAKGHSSFGEFLSGLCEGRIERDEQGFSSDNSSGGDLDEESKSSSTQEHLDETLHYSYDYQASSSGEETDDPSLTESHTSDINSRGEVELENAELSIQLQNMTELAHSQSIELYQAKYALNEALQQRDRLEKELGDMKLMGQYDVSNLGKKSLAELTLLEQHLKKSLGEVTKARDALSNCMEEERYCVICCEQPRSVLLMACRHLCVCASCSMRDELDRCPLCRETILEKISVFQ